jgi:sigma-B regulation protein RsbU (phosphoserine phosphatase)
MEIAARLQASFLSPVQMELGKFRLLARYRPSASIGGDFYDLRACGPHRASIFLADAVGHGVSAALLAAMLKVALEDAIGAHAIPSMVLSVLNHSFQFCAERGKFLTAFSGMLDCDTGELVYALAGHVPPLVYRGSDNTVEKLDSPGYCLGIFEKGQYADSSIRISPGDRLFVFTDGIYEASPDDRSIFGLRLPRLLEECANQSNEEFMDRLETSLLSFLGSGDAEDDYTLLSIQSQPSAKSKRDSEN